MRERVHIVGIGGVGMSALAQALLDSGVEVSGSDRLLDKGDSTPVLNCLASQKVALFPQDGSGVEWLRAISWLRLPELAEKAL
jgi:UDP-N-acetylmuramate-alanine ligase